LKKINIGFSGNNLRIMELGDSGEVSRLEEVILSFNLEDDVLLKKNRKEYFEEFSGVMKEVLDTSSLEPFHAGILIDTGLAFMNIIPVDLSEGKSNINSHLLWDLSNYFPDSYKDYSVKYIRLNNHPVSDSIDEILLIAISKNKIEFLKNLCNNCNIIIQKIEIDQFAVEKYIKSRKQTSDTALIIGYRNNRLDISLIIKGTLKYYDFELTERDNFKKSLLKQMNFFTGLSGNGLINEINLYGEEKIKDLKNFLTESLGSLPDHGVKNIELLNDDVISESKYAPLYGLAISNKIP